MSDIEQLDAIDLRILQTIQTNGRVPVVDLAERVNLSKSPCLKRLRRLEKDGFIRGYSARLDPKKLAQGHLVFVQVKLANTSRSVLEHFNRAVQTIPQIQSCHMMSGGYDYLLKIRSKDMEDYRILLSDVISALPGIAQTSTFPVMEEVKDDISLAIAFG
jgi:Lrp/AsnC family transcriptional regulator, leucine-responsive regulatory protein